MRPSRKAARLSVYVITLYEIGIFSSRLQERLDMFLYHFGALLALMDIPESFFGFNSELTHQKLT